MVVLALSGTNGVERWRHVAQNETENDEMERENEREVFGVHLVPFSLIRIRNAFDSLSSRYSAVVGRSRISARKEVDVAAGKNSPSTNGTVRHAVWSAGVST